MNTVVGFIGPEYLYDARQILRAGLEDHFMGKLLGVPMGWTSATRTTRRPTRTSSRASPCCWRPPAATTSWGALGDDFMLDYQSSSFHDTPALRDLLDLSPTPEFEAWLEARGLMEDGRLTALAGDARALA